MPKTWSASNVTEHGLVVVREHYLVELGFSTPVRLSSRDTLTHDGVSWTGVDMKLLMIMDGTGGVLEFLDDDFFALPSFIAEGSAGIPATIKWMWGDEAFGATDDDEPFIGELGAATENADGQLVVPLIEEQENWIPNIYINEDNGFNHLPIDGFKFETPNGIVELRRKQT